MADRTFWAEIGACCTPINTTQTFQREQRQTRYHKKLMTKNVLVVCIHKRGGILYNSGNLPTTDEVVGPTL